MFLFVEQNTLRQRRKGKKLSLYNSFFFFAQSTHSDFLCKYNLYIKKVLVLFFMKKKEKIHVKEIFQINLVENVSTQDFCRYNKKRRKIVQKVMYLFRYNQKMKKNPSFN